MRKRAWLGGISKMRKGVLGTLTMVMVLALGASLVNPLWTQASEYSGVSGTDYTTESYNISAVVDTSHTVYVTESITVDFQQGHHGIQREIPLGVGEDADDEVIYDITDLQVEGWDYEYSTSDEVLTLTIGDENTYLYGEQTFTFSYHLVYYLDDSEEYDYFAQNFLPTQWETSIESSTITLSMPADLNWEEVTIYEGAYGSTLSESVGAAGNYFTSSVDEDTNVLTLVGTDIPSYYGVTIRDNVLPEGYWSNAVSYGEAQMPWYLLGAGIFVLGALAMGGLWFMFGRDKHMTKVLEFHPPMGLNPAAMGYLLDGEITDEEMMTLLFYMASKHYIRIQEYREDKYRLIRLADPLDDEAKEVQKFFHGLFVGGRKEVKLDNLPESFRDRLDDCRVRIAARYSEGKQEDRAFRPYTRGLQIAGAIVTILFPLLVGLWNRGALLGNAIGSVVLLVPGMLLLVRQFEHRNSDGKRGWLLVGFVCTCISILFLGYSVTKELGSTFSSLWTGFAFGAVISVAMSAMAFFSVFMSARTDANVMLMGRILGFREFIKTAEYDRLKMLVDENPEYFYDVLPYAEVFGLGTEWAKKFTSIKIEKPDWYDTYEMRPFTYSPLWGYHMMHVMRHSLPMRHLEIDDMHGMGGHMGGPRGGLGGSGGIGGMGGFSGGGFSGGGGGGGGGGAW